MPKWKQWLRAGQLYDFVGSFRSAFRGVYSSFEEARLAVPAGAKFGHDREENTKTHRGYVNTLRFSDYAVLFWLSKILTDSSSVFDLGGHIGVTFYGFEKYLNFGPNLSWTVCDVPKVAESGREFAASRNEARISFTSDFAEANGKDVLVTAGAIQYIPTPFPEILASLTEKPMHLLINRVPLFHGSDFFTLQKIGGVLNPYHIFGRKDFLDSLERLGYRVIDSWDVMETYCGSCVIPFHPEKTVEPYSGLYLRLES